MPPHKVPIKQTDDGHDHHDLVAAAADEAATARLPLSMSWNHVTAEPLSYEEAKRSGWRPWRRAEKRSFASRCESA